MASENAIELLNSFLKTENLSVETYQTVLEKAETDEILSRLKKIQQEHRETARMLAAQIEAWGGEVISVDEHPGETVMSVLAEVSSGPARDTFSVKALRAREEESILNYGNAVEKKELGEEVRRKIETVFLPRARQHVSILDGLESLSKPEAEAHR